MGEEAFVSACVDAASELAAEDLADLGFVAHVTKLWMPDPAVFDALVATITSTARSAGRPLPAGPRGRDRRQRCAQR